MAAASDAGRFGETVSAVNFVLDTNAVRQTEKPRPNSEFMAWLDAQEPAHLFITTISLGEVWHGFQFSKIIGATVGRDSVEP